MSESSENNVNSPKLTELENITGWEIQLYVPKPVAETVEGSCQKQDLHSQLSKALREMVHQSISPLKSPSPGKTRQDAAQAVPISFRVPEDCDTNNMTILNVSQEQPLQKKQRTMTSLFKEIYVSFKLPEDCAIDFTDVDKLQLPVSQAGDDKKTQNGQNVRQFSFSERLDGWNIERRKRINGRYDLYYHHIRSQRIFRSTIEVVNFLLYEAYPDYNSRKAINKGKSEEDHLAQGSKCRKGTSLRRKWASPKFESSSKLKEKMGVPYCEEDLTEERVVKEFLDTAYKNLLNSSNKYRMPQNFSCGSEPAEKCTDFSYDRKQENARKTVEAFLDEAYKNLLNSFNDEKANVPQGNKRGRVEEPKEEATSNAIPSQHSVSPKPIKEQANPAKLPVNSAEVEDDPAEVEVEDSRGTSSSSPSAAYSDQCDLINHIPQVSEFELVFFMVDKKRNSV